MSAKDCLTEIRSRSARWCLHVLGTGVPGTCKLPWSAGICMSAQGLLADMQPRLARRWLHVLGTGVPGTCNFGRNSIPGFSDLYSGNTCQIFLGWKFLGGCMSWEPAFPEHVTSPGRRVVACLSGLPLSGVACLGNWPSRDLQHWDLRSSAWRVLGELGLPICICSLLKNIYFAATVCEHDIRRFPRNTPRPSK